MANKTKNNRLLFHHHYLDYVGFQTPSTFVIMTTSLKKCDSIKNNGTAKK